MHTSGIQSKPHKALVGTGQATANKLVPAILEAGGRMLGINMLCQVL